MGEDEHNNNKETNGLPISGPPLKLWRCQMETISA